MSHFNADEVLTEARRLLLLTVVAAGVTVFVLVLDRYGGHVAAGLGLVAASFAHRLLRIAADKPSK